MSLDLIQVEWDVLRQKFCATKRCACRRWLCGFGGTEQEALDNMEADRLHHTGLA